MDLVLDGNSLTLSLDGRVLIRHTPQEPWLFVGRGEACIEGHRGTFDVRDRLQERLALPDCDAIRTEDGWALEFSLRGLYSVTVFVAMEEGRLVVRVMDRPRHLNRCWLRLVAEAEEHVYGCGEQFSHFDLRGRNFPLWASEQGVGRNKKTLITFFADQMMDNAGGDYFWTFFPQPTFLSSRLYYCHIDCTAYMDFDFSHAHHHELLVWDGDIRIVFEAADDWAHLVGKLSDLLGRRSGLPDWAYDGLWLGVQGGTDVCLRRLERVQASGVQVAAVWLQDWQGQRATTLGQIPLWNWSWDRERYPRLDEVIGEARSRGIRFLGYVNPYLASEGCLFAEASARGFLVRNREGCDYLLDFGEYSAGMVDLTHPAAFEWLKDVLRRNLIDLGFCGWMADLGEYLPADARLHNRLPAEIMHNAWPGLWARCNQEAIADAGRSDEVFFFMRAGGVGSQRHCPLLWAGAQNVDWSLDDGLASVIPAALSAGLCGNGLHHSDIGGHTTVPQFGLQRGKELLLRWAEMAVFTPIMRTHEGNWPEANWQIDSDDDTLQHFARLGALYRALSPYTRSVVQQHAHEGIPAMRPLFMHYPSDPRCQDAQYQYLYGRDLLVAPVHEEGRSDWRAYLPDDDWVHLWTGVALGGGEHEVEAPLGHPPVFYRRASPHAELFRRVGSL